MQSKACFSYALGAKEENKRSLLIDFISVDYIKELPCGEALFLCFYVMRRLKPLKRYVTEIEINLIEETNSLPLCL